MIKNQKGFVMVFVMAVVAALSVMTGAMFFYYDNDLKSVIRNSVMQQVTLAAETGLQEGQRWIADQLNSNTFNLVDIQNNLNVVDSNNTCLNRHGYTNVNEDVYYAKRIQENLASGSVPLSKFEDISYEVFIQRQVDVVRSLYLSAQGSKNNTEKDATYYDRSFALVERFKDFPTKQFTIEMWINNKQPTKNYNTHLFEFGRTGDAAFKVKNDKWSPILVNKKLGGDAGVATPIKNEWVHIAWVWDGGNPSTMDSKNVRIYQNGELVGTYDADVIANDVQNYENPPESLPIGNWPLAIGEGLAGFTRGDYKTGKVKIQSTPWFGNIAEMRIWNISRSEDDIANNRRKRLTGSEPGLVSYYKFNEGTGNIAKDSNTSKSNDATIYGIGNKGTLWEAKKEYYPLTSTNNKAPTVNFPPGEDLVFYKILSCGNGPQGQIVPLELIVSAPVQKGDVGDGKIALTPKDLKSITIQSGTSLKIGLASYVGNSDVAGDISIQQTNVTNTGFPAFRPSMEQCENGKQYTQFDSSNAYNEGECVEFEEKLWILEKDTGKSAGDDFEEVDWVEVLGSQCDGVKFNLSPGDDSYGHYYKYFSTAPNLTPGAELGYNYNSISWWEAKRRAEQSTCGGMRGYLVSIESLAENNFIKNAVMCDNSTDFGCTGVTPFHVAADETREIYYGSRLASANDQHYIWLANSDWRFPLQKPTADMRSESGPDMGVANSFTHWQSGEPNSLPGEHFVDMEINRSGRVNGKWNDLKEIPGCSNNGLDCITGYVVEYGGFDSFKLDHDENKDGNKDGSKDLSEKTKTCVVRATIEKDKYVPQEDYLRFNSAAEDASALVYEPDFKPYDTDMGDSYPGWDVNNGVLTLFHNDRPTNWDPNDTYQVDKFTWFNNRVWKNVSGGTITGGAILDISKTPTIYNPYVWELYSGNEPDAPCGDLNFWQQAFESIEYINTLAVDPKTAVNPYAATLPGAVNSSAPTVKVGSNVIGNESLGERVIIFSLGPLHVQKHLDGYNHFYEFYQFPVRASGVQDLYNDNNRRMNESFTLSNQMQYFSKTGYLVTVTSEEENDILTEKAIGNGWLGGMTQTIEQSDYSKDGDLDECGGILQRVNMSGSGPNITGRIVAQKDFQAMRQLEKTRAGAIIMINSLSNSINKIDNIIPVDSTKHFPKTGVIKIGSELIAYTGKTANTFTGVVRGAESTTPSSHDKAAAVTETDVGFIWSWYKENQNYSGTTTKPKYIRYIDPEFRTNTSVKTITDISETDGSTPTVVTTNSNHGLKHDDIVNLTDKDPDADGSDDIDGTNLKAYYRVVKINATQFQLVDLDTRKHIDTSDINYIPDSAQMRELEGIRNEYYRTLTTLKSVGAADKRRTQTGLEMFWKDPKVNWSDANDPNTSQNSDCPIWRWVTGPEQFLHDHRGLAFAPTRSHTDNPSANQNSSNHEWVRNLPKGPTGEQIGEKFRDDMPFRYWAPGEPNNYRQREPGLHMMGTHFGSSQQLHWNDLYNWNKDHNNSYSIRGIIVEYGGLESFGDPIVRIATKRIINLYDRRVTQATVKISNGIQGGDKLVVGMNLSPIGLVATGDDTDTIVYTGVGTCKNYLDAIKATIFEHDGGLGIREITVKIGDAVKPVGSDHYYKKVDGTLGYQQADYQASYSNLCGLQGYLANVTTAEDLSAIASLGVTLGNEAWINGTDRCLGGAYKSGFWRYTSGPLKDKEFWRLRIDYLKPVDIDTACIDTNLRPSQTNVRVGPFESANWLSGHPSLNDNDYLTFLSDSTPGIKTRGGFSNPTVNSYIIKYGGSVGDYSGTDIQEVNNIEVGSGPLRAEISFYADGSENSIFINNEDTLKVSTTGNEALSTGWTKTQSYTTQTNPLTITPPTNQAVKGDDWKRELAKVYYENETINSFTPGNRRIKIVLIYADVSLNDTIGIVKNIGSKNKVTVSPISWSNR